MVSQCDGKGAGGGDYDDDDDAAEQQRSAQHTTTTTAQHACSPRKQSICVCVCPRSRVNKGYYLHTVALRFTLKLKRVLLYLKKAKERRIYGNSNI